MLLFVVPIGAGLALGWVLGGRVTGLGRVKLRAVWLLVVALGAQAIVAYALVDRLDRAARTAVILATYVAVAAFLVRNLFGRALWFRTGLALLAAGWLLNAVPISLNGGMPVSSWAVQQLGADAGQPVASGFFKHVVADGGTHLRFLGDVIPVSAVRQVLSVGDVVLALGVVATIAGGMATRPARHGRRRRAERVAA